MTLDERQAWVAVVLFIVALEKHLKDNHRPMLTHAVHRNPYARLAVAVVALHLLDHRRRLQRVDPVSYLGRYL